MASSIAFCCGKNEYWVGTEEISSVPVSLLIRSCDGSNRVFCESFRSGKVKVKVSFASAVLSGRWYEKYKNMSGQTFLKQSKSWRLRLICQQGLKRRP